MDKSCADITAEINRGIMKLRQNAPDAMAGFSTLSKGALKAGVLPELQKEPIALAIGVARHCDGCIGFHAKALVRVGAKREGVMETLAVAVYMGGGPSLIYAANARCRRSANSPATRRRRLPRQSDSAHAPSLERSSHPKRRIRRGTKLSRLTVDVSDDRAVGSVRGDCGRDRGCGNRSRSDIAQ